MKMSLDYTKKIIGENDILHIFGINTKEHHNVKLVGKITNQVDVKIDLVDQYTANLCDLSQDVILLDSMYFVGFDCILSKHIFKCDLIGSVVLLMLIFHKFVSSYQVNTKN